MKQMIARGRKVLSVLLALMMIIGTAAVYTPGNSMIVRAEGSDVSGGSNPGQGSGGSGSSSQGQGTDVSGGGEQEQGNSGSGGSNPGQGSGGSGDSSQGQGTDVSGGGGQEQTSVYITDISLSHSEINMQVGDVKAFTINVTPENAQYKAGKIEVDSQGYELYSDISCSSKISDTFEDNTYSLDDISGTIYIKAVSAGKYDLNVGYDTGIWVNCRIIITPPVHKVTFNLDGGTINSGSITEYTEGVETILPEDVTKEGYIFDGWYDNQDFTGSKVTKITATDNEDKTFWAKWIREFNVVISSDVIFGVVSSDISKAVSGKKVKLTVTPDDSCTFKNFIDLKGLLKEEDFVKETDNTYYFIMPDGDVEIKAVFEANSNYQKFENGLIIKPGESLVVPDVCNTTNGMMFKNSTLYTLVRADISGDTVTESETGEYYVFKYLERTDSDDGGNIVAKTYVKSGSSWDSYGLKVTDISDGVLVSVNDEGAVTLSTHEIEYTVTFNSNGGSEVSSQKVVKGHKVESPSNPKKSEYEFAGWYKEEACTNSWDFTKDTVNEDITLYAKWKKIIIYTVTFKVVNGKWNGSDGGKEDKVVVKKGYEGDTFKLLTSEIPAVGGNPNDNYKVGSWDTEPVKDSEVNADATYTYTYAPDFDKSQKVTFKVENGAWNDGTTDDKVVTLTGKENDTLRIVTSQIPEVGKPAENFKEGNWYLGDNQGTPLDKGDITEISVTSDITLIYRYKEKDKISAKVKFKVLYGSWDDGTTEDKVVEVTGYEGNKLKLSADQIPGVGKKPQDISYKAGSWDQTIDSILSNEIEAGTYSTAFIYSYVKKKEISQTVTFKVVNGSWNDGNTEIKTETLTGYEGDVLKLSADQIPAVGEKPDTNYTEGSWNTVPSIETEITAATTYIYTYTKKQEITRTVTFKVVNGMWNVRTKYVRTKEFKGFEGDVFELAKDDIPEVGSQPDTAYKEGSWDKVPVEGAVITEDITYTYTYAPKTPATRKVTFKVVNGTWKDGTKENKVVTLTGYEEDKINLTSSQLPSAGNNPDEGYKAGRWDTEPKAYVNIPADVTYTYTYAKKQEESSGDSSKTDDKSGSGDSSKTDDKSSSGDSSKTDDKSSSGGSSKTDDKSSSGDSSKTDDKSSSGDSSKTDDKNSSGGSSKTDDKSSSGGSSKTDDKSSSGGSSNTDDKNSSGGSGKTDDKGSSGGSSNTDDKNSAGNNNNGNVDNNSGSASKAGIYSNEWVDGKWYGSNGEETYAAVGGWKSNGAGWWFEDSSGWYPVSQWLRIDGRWYYFTASGYMDYSEYRDGCWLGSDGAWDESYANGIWHYDGTGWWYEDNGWYPASTTLWIDGTNYSFDASGYIE